MFCEIRGYLLKCSRRALNAHLDTVGDPEPSALVEGSNIAGANPPFVIFRPFSALRTYR